jgi:hypothetical protein
LFPWLPHQRIFSEYVPGLGIGAIAEALNLDRIPSPSGHDPARKHRPLVTRPVWDLRREDVGFVE